MSKVITFLCTNPLENFLPLSCQSGGKLHYEELLKVSRYWPYHVRRKQVLCEYGEVEQEIPRLDVPEDFLFLYVQSRRRTTLEKVFRHSDLVVVSMPASSRELEKLFVLIARWRDKILFLWNQHWIKSSSFQRQISREYKLEEEQLLEVVDTDETQIGFMRIMERIFSRVGSVCYGRCS